jgi:hypothetical protein
VGNDFFLGSYVGLLHDLPETILKMQVIVMQVMMRLYHPDPHHAEMRWTSGRPEHCHYLLAKERKDLRMQRQKMGL